MGEPKCASRDEGRGGGDGGTDHIVVLASQASGERVGAAPALITALLETASTQKPVRILCSFQPVSRFEGQHGEINTNLRL